MRNLPFSPLEHVISFIILSITRNHCHNCLSKPQKCLLVSLYLLRWLMLRKIAGQLLLSSNSYSAQNFIIVLLKRVISAKLVSVSWEQAHLEHHTLPKLVQLLTTIHKEALIIRSLSDTRKPSKTKKVTTLLLANTQMFGKCSVKLV